MSASTKSRAVSEQKQLSACLLPKAKRCPGINYLAVPLLCLLASGWALAFFSSPGNVYASQQDGKAKAPSASASPTPENLSPSAVLRAYVEAASKKDVAGMKSHLSAGTLKIMEEAAGARNKNLDDMLKEEVGQMPPESTDIEYSNEKIDGDNATVDMTAQGQTITMPLVKENGEWKIAIDKFIEEMKKKLSSEPARQ